MHFKTLEYLNIIEMLKQQGIEKIAIGKVFFASLIKSI